MKTQIRQLLASHRELLAYLLVGGTTTGINLVVYFALLKVLGSWFYANLIAWLLSVLFAFFANHKLVFHAQAKTPMAFLIEALSFYMLRLASLGADNVILWIGISLLKADPLLVKLIDQITVVALNYGFSKRLFRKPQPVKEVR